MNTSHHLRHASRWASAATLLALTGAAQAALISLGDGTVQDTNTNLVWVQDWGIRASADRASQIGWADGLDFAGSTDWRLPSFAEYQSLSTYGRLRFISEFSNIGTGEYWTTSLAPVPGFFRTIDGDGGGVAQQASARAGATAVRTGTAITVAPTPVPEPQTLALALLALGAAAVVRIRPG